MQKAYPRCRYLVKNKFSRKEGGVSSPWLKPGVSTPPSLDEIRDAALAEMQNQE